MTTIIDKILLEINQIILGKSKQIKLVLTCLLARGHLLIEDIPGVGKTTLAHTIARLLGLQYTRIQFTSDILPADITGVSIYDKTKQCFVFQPGPLFAQMVLADELNRATPRTQSALLEAMEEKQVSLDGNTYALPSPFFVIATQNQRHHIGTFPLPESQLDRFLMRLQLGYPDPQSERKLFNSPDRLGMVKAITAVTDTEKLLQLQNMAEQIHVSDAILDYVQDIMAASRNQPGKYLGLSPRAGIALIKAAKAWAFGEGRAMVLPEDIQTVAGPVLEHRLNPEGNAAAGNEYRATEILIQSIAVH
jgi:MoxR-like ATPase